MKDDLSFSFNDSFPPKRNFKVGKFQQRTARHPPLLMKLLPTCTFNFTPSSPFLFLFVRLLSLFFFLPLSPSLFPFFSLTFLTSVHSLSQVHRLTSHWVHILLLFDCVSYTVYSLMAVRYVYLSTSSSISYTTPCSFHEILKIPFEPHLFSSSCPSRTWSFKLLLVEFLKVSSSNFNFVFKE